MTTQQPCIAAIDIGTSSLKLVVYEQNGNVLAQAQADYPTRTSAHGEVEQNPDDWWQATKQALAASGMAKQITALALTGQMQDLIAVDANDSLRPAMLYSDVRATKEHDHLVSSLQDWETTTLNHQDVSSVLAKILWLTNHEPQVITNAHHLLFSAPGYVAWKATGVAACDNTTASTTGLLDIHQQSWFTSAFNQLSINPKVLPRLVGSSYADMVIGTVGLNAAEFLAIQPGIPVVLAMGDAGSTTAGLVGSHPDDAYIYLGTTGWIAGITTTPPKQASPMHCLSLPTWKTWLRIGAVQSAGSASAWALQTFFPGKTFVEAEQLVQPYATTLDSRPLCLPGLTGERTPVRDGDMRGVFFDVHETTTPQDFYLSVLTGVAFGLRHAADQMGIQQNNIALVGGGSASPIWRQIISDVFNATIITGAADNPGCFGAFMAATQALQLATPIRHGLLGDHPQETGFSGSEPSTRTTPSDLAPQYEQQRAVHRGLYDVLQPSFKTMRTIPSSNSTNNV